MSASFSNPAAAWMHDALQGGMIYGSASYIVEHLYYLLQPHTIHAPAMGTQEAQGATDRVGMNFLPDDALVSSRISMKEETPQRALFYFDKGDIHILNHWKARGYFIMLRGVRQRKKHLCVYEMKYKTAHIHAYLESGPLESLIIDVKRSTICCFLADEIMRQLSSKEALYCINEEENCYDL